MPSYSDKGIVDRILDRQGYMQEIRDPWETDCDNIIDMFRPDMVKFKDTGTTSPNKILGAKIYEGTGPWAMRLMTDGIQGHMVSKSIEWFRYSMEQQQFKGVDEVNAWLQALEEHMYSVYRKSNYYEALGPFCRTGVSVGSPIMIPEQDKESTRIKCIVPHPVERYLMQNVLGETNVLHLKSDWTVRNAVQEFGKESFSDSVQNSYNTGNDGEKVTIIRAIYFSLDSIFNELPKSNSKYKPDKPWMSYYIELNARSDAVSETKEPLRVEGYFTKPFIGWHYEKDMREVYARTPSWYAYWDVKSLARNRKSMLMAGQRQVEHAWWVPRSMQGKFKNYPKGINWYDPAQKEYKPEVLEDGSNISISGDLEDRMAKAVERWFHVRMWMMLSIWSEERKAPPTATQIIEMAGERAILLAPRIGRFMTAMEENDDRFIDIEDRAGRLPPPPDVVLELSDGRITPEFIGPLAQLQKQYHSIRRTQTALAAIAPLVELDPMVRHKIKAEVAAEHLLEENKFYQDAIRSNDEYAELVAAIAQKEAMQEGLQMGTEVAKAVPSVSKDIEPNSPLALMAGAA